MRILVTGGAGYKGTHTAKALAEAGDEVIVLDNFSSSQFRFPFGTVVQANLCDRALVRQILLDYAVEAVCHLAGSGNGVGAARPHAFYYTNLSSSIGLLDAMVETGVEQIVFGSTWKTYGGTTERLHESSQLAPLGPYAESKLAGERALGWYAKAHKIRYVVLRTFLAAGAAPGGDLGEIHAPETHLVPLALMAAAGVQPRLPIYGTTYPTPDGTAVRDYVHVCDVASAAVCALRYLQWGGENTVFNIGSGTGHSVLEVIAAVERVTGRSVATTPVAPVPGFPAQAIADITKARRELKWRPLLSDLDTIVGTAWQWFRNLHVQREVKEARRQYCN